MTSSRLEAAIRRAGSTRPAGRPAALAGSLLLLLLALAAHIPGCQSGYVLKQGSRQLALARRQVPLAEAMESDELPAEAKEKLRWVPCLLSFARDELGLDPGDAYTTFLDTSGESISHAVFAAPPLALVPFQWRFPVAGVVPYKGFFDLAAARAEEACLRDRGFDTVILPVGAFSTLGWFRDPVLSTMLGGGLADLAETIIHETTHRTLYFPGDTTLNESLASHVAWEGTRRFLAAHEELRGLAPSYLEETAASRANDIVIGRLRADLEALYASPLPDARKQSRKAELFATASAACARLRPGSTPASIPASNAYLLAVASYEKYRPRLERLQAALGGHPRDLVAYLKMLAKDGDKIRDGTFWNP